MAVQDLEVTTVATAHRAYLANAAHQETTAAQALTAHRDSPEVQVRLERKETEATLVLAASLDYRVETENPAGTARRARKASRETSSFRRARCRRAPSKARRVTLETMGLGASLVA